MFFKPKTSKIDFKNIPEVQNRHHYVQNPISLLAYKEPTIRKILMTNFKHQQFDHFTFKYLANHNENNFRLEMLDDTENAFFVTNRHLTNRRNYDRIFIHYYSHQFSDKFRLTPNKLELNLKHQLKVEPFHIDVHDPNHPYYDDGTFFKTCRPYEQFLTTLPFDCDLSGQPFVRLLNDTQFDTPETSLTLLYYATAFELTPNKASIDRHPSVVFNYQRRVTVSDELRQLFSLQANISKIISPLMPISPSQDVINQITALRLAAAHLTLLQLLTVINDDQLTKQLSHLKPLLYESTQELFNDIDNLASQLLTYDDVKKALLSLTSPQALIQQFDAVWQELLNQSNN